MLDKQVAKLLNEQVNKEFYSAYLYLDMSNYYQVENLNGFANWFSVQAQEERDHALLFIAYLAEQGIRAEMTDIGSAAKTYTDFAQPLTGALEHERFVTASINSIYAAAEAVKDYSTMQFLTWFINEQREEEKNADDNIKKYELFGKDSQGLYLLNSELAARVYTAPSLTV